MVISLTKHVHVYKASLVGSLLLLLGDEEVLGEVGLSLEGSGGLDAEVVGGEGSPHRTGLLLAQVGGFVLGVSVVLLEGSSLSLAHDGQDASDVLANNTAKKGKEKVIMIQKKTMKYFEAMKKNRNIKYSLKIEHTSG